MPHTTTFRILLALLCFPALAGCVSREQADAKLIKGCTAGVSVLLPEGRTVGEIKGSQITASPEGPDFRHVTLNAVEKDNWLENEVQYECTFEEEFGFMNSSYTGSIYQIKFDDQVYGKSGGEILGSAEDFLKLTDAIRKAMYQ
jgi:hypothetical protein